MTETQLETQLTLSPQQVGGMSRSQAKIEAARANGRKGGRPRKDRRSRRMRLIGSSVDDNWGTPQCFFNEVNAEFHFNLDAAASASNAKCGEFFTKIDDALQQTWSGRVWLNPPYGRIATPTFIRKASEERSNCEVIVVLVPSRTSTQWWRDYVWDSANHKPHPGVELRCPPRLQNDTRNHPSKSERRWPFPCALIVFRPD
jgi:hypothetical protein